MITYMIKYCEDRITTNHYLQLKEEDKGWSYKAASLCAWEYTFFPGSSSIIGTFLSSLWF